MKRCVYDVTKRRTHSMETEGNWLALVEPLYTNRLDETGLRIANSLSTVTDGHCEVALLNVNDQDIRSNSDETQRLEDNTTTYMDRVRDESRNNQTAKSTEDQQITVIDIRQTRRPDEATLFEDARSVFTGLQPEIGGQDYILTHQFPCTDKRGQETISDQATDCALTRKAHITTMERPQRNAGKARRNILQERKRHWHNGSGNTHDRDRGGSITLQGTSEKTWTGQEDNCR